MSEFANALRKGISGSDSPRGNPAPTNTMSGFGAESQYTRRHALRKPLGPAPTDDQLEGTIVMRRFLIALIALLPAAAPPSAPQAEAVHVRVADVGAGLCCIFTLPDADEDGEPEYVIYDGGNGAVQTFNKIEELIPDDADIQLLVISHSDSDHLAAIPGICDAYHVKKVLRTGFARTTGAWTSADSAIKSAADLRREVGPVHRGHDLARDRRRPRPAQSGGARDGRVEPSDPARV
jgi:hypothetical protein